MRECRCVLVTATGAHVEGDVAEQLRINDKYEHRLSDCDNNNHTYGLGRLLVQPLRATARLTPFHPWFLTLTLALSLVPYAASW